MVNETQGYIAILVFEQGFSSLPMFEDCHGLDVFVNKYFHKVALEVGNNNIEKRQDSQILK